MLCYNGSGNKRKDFMEECEFERESAISEIMNLTGLSHVLVLQTAQRRKVYGGSLL